MKTLFTVIFAWAALISFGQDAPQLTPQEGKALVVFIRPPELTSALDNWVLLADNEEFCRISNNRYVLYHAKPGKVNFSSRRGGIGIGKPVTGIDFELKEGEVYFVQCQVKTNLINVRILLNEITERTANQYLTKAKPDNCEIRRESEDASKQP